MTASSLVSARQGAEPASRAAVVSDGWLRAVYVLFFVSGMPALIYQLVWQRALFRIFGVNIESVTIVVTAFMLGLGVGSLAGGWLSKRGRLPLLPVLASIELVTALFGLISLELFEWVGEQVLGLPLLVTAAVTLGLVIVPTLLMGATLPILVGHLARRLDNTGHSVGLLYYVNTLGAGAACILAALVLFPLSGLRFAVWVAIALNALVAIAALALHAGSQAPQDPLRRPETRLPHAASLQRFLPVLGLAAFGGFVSLSYEIFFFRVQSYATGSSASAFAVTLAAFLIGLAGGSRAVGAACAGWTRKQILRQVFYTLVVACALGAAYLPVLNAVAGVPAASIAVSVLFVFLIARAWGMLLPVLAHLAVAPDEAAGSRVSFLYLANILGSAAGSLITGFVLMDYFGIVQLSQILVVAGLTCAVLLGLTLPLGRPHRRGYAAGVALLVLAAVAVVPVLTHRLPERLRFGAVTPAEMRFVRVIENRNGIIAADAHGTVWGHGMYDGAFNTMLRRDVNRVVRPYALSLFHPAPRKVLVIGFASGSWSRVIGSHPDLEALTVVEINPSYLQMAAERAEVASVLTDPKVKIVIDDGRRWLRLHPDEKFDAIVSNTTWYFRANATNLLSQEFLQLAARHLAPGGVFFFNTTGSGRVQRTACLAMPHGLRFDNHMLVSNDPIKLDFRRWRDALLRYKVDGQPVIAETAADRAMLDRLLAYERQAADPAVPSTERMIEWCSDIERRTEGLAAFTDDNMGSEWRHILGLDD